MAWLNTSTTTRPRNGARENRESHPHTWRIKFLGVGEDEAGERFLKVKVRDKAALLKVDGLRGANPAELTILTRLGEPLLAQPAIREFIGRAQEQAREDPSFKVATRIGLRDGVFVLPDGPVPEGRSTVELSLDPRYAVFHRKFRCAGTPGGWKKMVALCRGKTRPIAGLALSFTGPLCAAFGWEPPGVQLVGTGGFGKTTIGKMASSGWGGTSDPKDRLGLGVSWNNTTDNLEVVAAAFSETLLFLDDMQNAAKDDVRAIMRIMQGQGKGRWTALRHETYCTPLFSTDNVPLARRLRGLGITSIEAYVDRLMELGPPEGCRYFFEGIDSTREFRRFSTHLRKLSSDNHGLAGRYFARRFAADLAERRAGLEAFLCARRDRYLTAAESIRSRRGRDLTRVSDRFATMYAAACLAVRYRILPFTEEEVKAALLTCQRDHVAFVDREYGIAGAPSPGAASTQDSVGPAIEALPPLDRLRKYVRDQAASFVRARSSAAKQRKIANPRGYIGDHRGQSEYWLTDAQFQSIAGGKNAALDLKRQLAARGVLATVRRGKGLSYVVKRNVPGVGRSFVVALRRKTSRRIVDKRLNIRRTRRGGDLR